MSVEARINAISKDLVDISRILVDISRMFVEVKQRLDKLEQKELIKEESIDEVEFMNDYIYLKNRKYEFDVIQEIKPKELEEFEFDKILCKIKWSDNVCMYASSGSKNTKEFCILVNFLLNNGYVLETPNYIVNNLFFKKKST